MRVLLVGDHIQGAFNVSRTPRCGTEPFPRSKDSTTTNDNSAASTPPDVDSVISSPSSVPTAGTTASPSGHADCNEIGKMQGMAVYFLHNKERSRSYYNLDVRNSNGTQKRVRSRDLPWGMKQVSYHVK